MKRDKKSGSSPAQKKEYWCLSAKKFDSTKLFLQFGEIFPEATSVFLEGISIVDEAKLLYQRFHQEGPYLPEKAILKPRSDVMRCNASTEFWQELADLSENHAEQELFCHIFVYQNANPLLEWWDAFSDPLMISTLIPRSNIENFAARNGLKVDILRG
jgi:hypothetical protein